MTEDEMHHLALTTDAETAITKVFSDRSVPIGKARESLEELAVLIDNQLDALNSDER